MKRVLRAYGVWLAGVASLAVLLFLYQRKLLALGGEEWPPVETDGGETGLPDDDQ